MCQIEWQKVKKIENASELLSNFDFFLGGVTNETTFSCDPIGLG